MKHATIAGALAAALLAIAAGAGAAPLKLCVPAKPGAAVLTPNHGKCHKGYKRTALGAEGKQGSEGKEGKAEAKAGAGGAAGTDGKAGPEGKTGPEGKSGSAGFSAGELETLKLLLAHVSYIGAGVGGKPTVRFSGVNVQIVNGEGKTASVNGEGNLVLGYDEDSAAARIPAGRQTGSHDLVLGEEQEFTSYGAIVAGYANTAIGPFDSVLGGVGNAAEGRYAAVSGGEDDVADGEAASADGGISNVAKGEGAVVSGGKHNLAFEAAASVFGGEVNEADKLGTVVGGAENLASGRWAMVAGGEANTASGQLSSILGGNHQTASGPDQTLP